LRPRPQALAKAIKHLSAHVANPLPTYERLRDTIAKRMRMSHVYQPLMLMELLGQGFARQQAAPPPRRT